MNWKKASVLLSRELGNRYDDAASQLTEFFPDQRLKFAHDIAGIQGRLGPAPVAEITSALTRQAQICLRDLGPKAVVVGIEKKGQGLLHEIAEGNPRFSGHLLINDPAVNSMNVRGRNVLVVDDSIHSGATVRRVASQLRSKGAKRIMVLAVLASTSGLNNLKLISRLEVIHLYWAPEKLFWVAFQVLLVPLLCALRNGAIPNRPHHTYEITPPRGGATVAAVETLSALARMRVVSKLYEVLVADGVRRKVYHGTLLFSSQGEKRISEIAGAHAITDQTKLRVFVDSTLPIHLNICAIYWPIADVRRKSQVMELEHRVVSWMFSQVEENALESLKSKGYVVNTLLKGGYPRRSHTI